MLLNHLSSASSVFSVLSSGEFPIVYLGLFNYLQCATKPNQVKQTNPKYKCHNRVMHVTMKSTDDQSP